jgi:uncharacterized membrane protein
MIKTAGQHQGKARLTPHPATGVVAIAAPLGWGLGAGLSLGLLAFELWLCDSLARLVLENSVSPAVRSAGATTVAVSALLGGAVVAFLLWRHPARVAGAVRWCRPFTVAGLLPPLLTPSIWHAQPLLCLAIAIAVSVALAWWLVPREATEQKRPSRRCARLVTVLLIVAIVAFAVFAAVATIEQHRRLETRAYDMGIMENVFWHTSQGRLLESSLEGRNHLGVHTSFIFLLIAPLYMLFPATETLLVVQAVAVALAAWPLFLLARRLLQSDRAALLVAALYLLQPTIQGATFYDFHELAFAPALFFAALNALLARRPILLWTSVALLLLVKEDCSLVVVALGIVALLEKRVKTGLTLIATGAVALVILQGLVIPHFAGRESSYAWYYTEIIPAGEGPAGLFKTLLLNPLYSLRVAITAPKALYLLQTLGPVLFLCLAGPRGLALVAYGIGMSVLASREYLFVLGFQYAWQLVPQAFAGLLIALRGMASSRWADAIGLTVRRAMVAMATMTAIFALHHGMLSPVSHFRSGFRIVRLATDEAARERSREVERLRSLIPPSASVTASETLVPHVARRMQVQTLRYAAESFGRDNDYYFVLKADLDRDTIARYQHVFESGGAYSLVQEGPNTVLFRRRDAGRREEQ